MKAKIPEGYQAITPYLILRNAAAFIEFTQQVFNATLVNKHMRDETIIMHAEIKIDDSIIMFADSTDEYKPDAGSFFIYVANADETYQKALNNGAQVITAVTDQPYGRSGGIKDMFGNTWWITSVI